MKIGSTISYDFTIDFPEMKKELGLTSKQPVIQPWETPSGALWRLEGKYTQLLEKYNKLLEIVVSLVDANELHKLGPEIAQLTKAAASARGQA